ncbi:MAG: DUF481 domain-containing protein [Bacteroidia bacterium]|jgi:hypothetical protein|nr:DUF481 domain-containing protein [Bacteroidia bacterium]
MNKIILLIISALITAIGLPIQAQQIVNMEGRRFENPKLGWQGTAEFGANFIQVNQNNINQLSNRLFVVHHTNKRNLLFVNDVTLVQSDNQNLVNNAFQHFRYIKQGDSTVFPEAFVQVQFNQQLDISLRVLSGAGFRFRLYKSEKSFFYIGNVLMYEYEQNPELDAQNNMRLSSYASLDFGDFDRIPVTFVGYLQPRINNINDYRVSVEASVLFKSKSKFSFRMMARYAYDAFPPPGINPFFGSFSNSLLYQF